MELPKKLEDWLPMPPTVGPPLPQWLGITWPWYRAPGADFRLSDLVISPTEVNPGQSVTITCLVTNRGSQSGDYTVNLGGDFMAQQTVTLGPGESQAVTFQVAAPVAGTYNVSIDGLSGSFRVTEAPVADIRVENLTVSPQEVYVGEKVTVSVTVKNYGNAAGSKNIVCTVS